jgi:formylglycine-generating enzyme required for sulfatase activity
MDRRTVLLGSLGFALPASAGNPTQQGETAKSLKVIPKTGDLAGEVLYTNSVAVIIGISKYQYLDQNAQLRYARKDAEDVREVLVKSFGFLASNIVTLVDDAATKKGIERALDQLSRTKPTDRVLVFYSGHGMTVKGSSGEIGVLVPYDAQVKLSDTSDGVVPECILMDVLWKYLQKAPAKHRLLIADACFSGLLAKSRALEAYNPAVLKRLVGEPALQAITASGKLEVSKENDELKNGIFTRKFIDVLTELAAAPGRVMTAREIADSVARRVSNATKAQQNPQYGDYEGTEGQFLFVSIDPGATPTLAPGTAKVTRKNVRAVLMLSGVPIGATVKVDGRFVTGGRYEIDLIDEPTKDVAIYVTADGYEPVVIDALLKSGETVAKTITMAKIPKCKLVFTGVPSGGVIKVDGKVIVGTELLVDMSTVESKRVSVVITASGYKADVADVDLAKGETVTYTFSAERDESMGESSAESKPALAGTPRISKGRLSDYPALRAYVEAIRLIPSGTFQMGSYGGSYPDENPIHRVTLSKFRMGATPVTFAVWKEYCASSDFRLPKEPSWGMLDDHPVVNVSWNDIMGSDGKGGFCAWASDIADIRLMLPTEAQWEYAARGGVDGQEYPWGNTFYSSRLWCSNKGYGDAGKTAPVSRISNIFRNSYGLTDMVGNVWQWCSDWYGPYENEPQTNPSGASSSPNHRRCVRGGSWFGNYPDNFRCNNRDKNEFDDWSEYHGFRLSTGPG